jgi:hypothetical protein
MKPHKWHKEIKKWADGAQIQFKIDDQWIDVPDDESPEWYEENEYRIKPHEQQEPYAYAYIREDGVGQLCWTKRDASLFKDLLDGWKEIPLYTDEALVNQISDSITLSATAGQFKNGQN